MTDSWKRLKRYWIFGLAALLGFGLAVPNAQAVVTVTKNSIGQITVDTGDGKPIFAMPMLGLNGTSLLPVGNGKSIIANVRNDYSSVNVTTSAFVTLVSALTGAVSEVDIFDSSGQTLKIGQFDGTCVTIASFVYVTPGGNGRIPLGLPSGACVRIEAVSGTANAGEIDVNFYQ